MTTENTPAAEEIVVNDGLVLRAVDERYVTVLHRLVEKNQRWLQNSLSWPAAVSGEDETRRHVQGNVMLHQRGYAKMFLLFLQDEMVGVLSFNQIEPINKTALYRLLD
ncbi:Ribosomal-protein-L7p-serine acetyltransferase [Raoultella terrigena]|uniref:Ribosomal-protein-L7p-serine acetyltransferase n=1 Tax=Raoultella terrigena TaxID=577 RepID=A0A7Z9CT87_RAOTE|nr:Ribosomal-protein-L7p-serine acetyltransferase [Raoultella terrigena]